MKLTNNEIYSYAKQLVDAFQDSNQYLPIKINFYLQKNKNLLLELAQDIEKARIEIAQRYGTLDSTTNQFIIAPEHIEAVSKELEDLFALEQEVLIHSINIDTFSDDLTLTTGQMEAMMFMIEGA